MSLKTGLVAVVRAQLPSAARESIKKDLTVFPVSTSSFNQTPEPVRLWLEDDEYLYMPRGYFLEAVKRRFDPDHVFETSDGVSELLPVAGVSFRPGQKEVVDEAAAVLQSDAFGGVIIEAQVGAGKSILGLETARRLGRKTLVVVHTSVLMDQWIQEIKRFYPEWSVGKVQGQTVDVHNNSVCVGMLQSLAMKDDYPDWLYREFGTIIVDEVHYCGSQEFKNVMFRFYPKYFIGLSGTPQRSDKAENVFRFGIGRIVKGQKIESLVPTIYFVDTKGAGKDFNLSDYGRQKHALLESLMQNDARNKLIVQNTVKAVQAGRHIIVLSERVAHVEILYALLKKAITDSNVKVGKMVGSSKKDERAYSQDAQVLVATAQLLAVGFNNPRLDTLIFATPIQAVVQPVGRVIRKHPEKKPPLVIDLVETHFKGARVLAKSRAKKYREKGWLLKNDYLLNDPSPSPSAGFRVLPKDGQRVLLRRSEQ